MIIKHDNFKNGGEVDFTAHYGERHNRGRLSVRKKDGNEYEVYVHWFRTKTDEVLYSGTLERCIEWTNARVGLNDRVE